FLGYGHSDRNRQRNSGHDRPAGRRYYYFDHNGCRDGCSWNQSTACVDSAHPAAIRHSYWHRSGHRSGVDWQGSSRLGRFHGKQTSPRKKLKRNNTGDSVMIRPSNTETNSPSNLDVILVGAGIMSATLAVFLKELDPRLKIELHEVLGSAAQESSNAWNNAGTGHAALCELNYTPQEPDATTAIS